MSGGGRTGRAVTLSIWPWKMLTDHADTKKTEDCGPWLAACSGRAFTPRKQAPLRLEGDSAHEGCGVMFQKALPQPPQGTEPQEGPAGPSHRHQHRFLPSRSRSTLRVRWAKKRQTHPFHTTPGSSVGPKFMLRKEEKMKPSLRTEPHF